MRVLDRVDVIEERIEQTSREQKQVGKSSMSFEHCVKLLLEAIWLEDADRVGACKKNSHVVVLLIYDWKDADGWACEGTTGRWMGDQLPFQEVMINVEPFMDHGEQQRGHRVSLPSYVYCIASRRRNVRGFRIGSMLVTCWIMPNMHSTESLLIN